MGQVIISPNPKKESVQIDIDGNEVIPFTKQIIKKNNDKIVEPPKPVVEPSKPNESILPGQQV